MSMASKKPGALKTTKRREFNSSEPSGLVLNKKGLRSFKKIAEENIDVEYLYLRENDFDAFDLYHPLYNLKILDLSINNLSGSIGFLHLTTNLRHLYLTGNKINTLQGLSELASLETLCMSDNDIPNFEGLEKLPNLRVLSLNYNAIENFRLFPFLPSLHTLNLVGNPIADVPSYRAMAIASCNPNLASMDSKPVLDEERDAVEHYRGKVVYCISEGFVVDGDNVEEEADAYLLRMQKNEQKAKPLQLHAISIGSTVPESNLLAEGAPVRLHVCMQDIRPLDQRQSDIFFSRHLFPVAFKVSGDASEVFVVGTMNNWAEPIPLVRVAGDDEVYFQTTMYLPAGDYEYRYIVDGVEKITEANKTASKFKQGMCNIYVVTEAQVPDDDQDTILHVRWMRSNRNNGFVLIDDENGLEYTPTKEDIGYCLRAEVLAYVNGEFSFLYFDISTPVVAGAPRCAELAITGSATEGSHLDVAVEYSGGQEGNSTLQWFRLAGGGGDSQDEEEEEEELALEDPWAGYDITLEDIGRRIKVVFTPMRQDWVAGEPESRVTGIVTAGVPTCRSIAIAGDCEQEKELVVEYEYVGGYEGESKFQWFRLDETADDFFPIPGETTSTYRPTLHDVNKRLAVEYTPVSREAVEGTPVRCVLQFPIHAAPPQLRSLEIKGQCEEQHVLMVEFDYFGGFFGAHEIQWHRRPLDRRDLVPIGRPNAATCTMTSKEVGCEVFVTFTPLRDDGERGETSRAMAPEVIRPGLPQLKTLQIAGEPQKGNILEAVVEYFGGEQGDSIIEWSRAAPDSRNFDVVAKQTRKYIIQQEDVGRLLKLSFTPVRKDGVQGEVKTRLIEIPAASVEPTPDASPTQQAQEPAAPESPTEPASAEEPAAQEAMPTDPDVPATAPADEAADAPAASEAPAATHVDPNDPAGPVPPAAVAGDEPEEEEQGTPIEPEA